MLRGYLCRVRTGWLSTLVCLLLAGAAAAQQAGSAVTIQPTVEQIVGQMERRNAARAEELKQYKSLRHYEVVYRGFSAVIEAKMAVEANYDAASGKTFRVVSTSGSKLLINKVLMRLLETEKAASADQRSTALTPANYRFTPGGMENEAGRPSYVLEVEPLTANKLLYRGKIWVDAADFAVVRIEGEPARNPSFWIAHTSIQHRYSKTEGFWLPKSNRSETKVRVGGTAVLTIDYGTYQVAPQAPLKALAGEVQ